MAAQAPRGKVGRVYHQIGLGPETGQQAAFTLDGFDADSNATKGADGGWTGSG